MNKPKNLSNSKTWADVFRLAKTFEFRTVLNFEECKTALKELNNYHDTEQHKRYKVEVIPSFQKFKLEQFTTNPKHDIDAFIEASIEPEENMDLLVVRGKSYPTTGMSWIMIFCTAMPAFYIIAGLVKPNETFLAYGITLFLCLVTFASWVTKFEERQRIIEFLKKALTPQSEPISS